MSTWLKVSTAIEIKLGPFVDDGDGFTPMTGLTIAQADVRLAKNAGDWAQKAEATTMVHEENGWYRCLLDTTDTNALGILIVSVNETGALPVWREFLVVPDQVWDSYLGADALQVHAVEMSAGLITATVIATDAIDADAIAANAIGASELAADAVTEIQAGLSTVTTAQVNAEVLDVLNVDTFAEIGQETPAATQTIRKMVAYLYKAWRNRHTQTSSIFSIYNDDETTVGQKATVSDDGTTFDRTELTTGP